MKSNIIDYNINLLVAEMIRISLHDLYFGNDKNRNDALLFFEQSEIFRQTNLDFEYLKRRFEEEHHIKGDRK